MPQPRPFDVGIQSSWRIRRRIIISTLLWSGVMVTYLAIWGRPTSLSETIALGCLALMGSVIGAYVFGATWDTKITRDSANQQQAIEAGVPAQANTQNVVVQPGPIQGSPE